LETTMKAFRDAFALSAAEVDELTPPGTVRILGASGNPLYHPNHLTTRHAQQALTDHTSRQPRRCSRHARQPCRQVPEADRQPAGSPKLLLLAEGGGVDGSLDLRLHRQLHILEHRARPPAVANRVSDRAQGLFPAVLHRGSTLTPELHTIPAASRLLTDLLFINRSTFSCSARPTSGGCRCPTGPAAALCSSSRRFS